MSASATALEFLHEWTGWSCHKIPERSPWDHGEVFPVCFRCAGLQLGLACSYLRFACFGVAPGRFPPTGVALQCVGLMVPFVVDGAGNALHLWNSPGWGRALTGLGVGLGLPWLLAPLAQAPESPPPADGQAALQNIGPLLLPAVGGAGAIVLLQTGVGGPAAFHLLACLATAGWLAFFGHFILALLRSYGVPAARRLGSRLKSRQVNA